MKRELSIYLDLLRIGAAFAVFFGHAYHFTGDNFSLLSGHASEAVAVFFVLSGFFISNVASDARVDVKQYASARMARIYSVAIPALVVTFIFDRIGVGQNNLLYDGASYFNSSSGLYEVFRYLTFTNEFWSSHIIFGTNEPFWSLGFEVCYYVIFGFFVFAPLKNTTKLVISSALLLAVGPRISIYFPLWLLGVWAHRVLISENISNHLLKTKSSAIICLLPFLGYVLLKLFMRYMRANGVFVSTMFSPFDVSVSYANTVLYYYGVGILVALHITTLPKIIYKGILSKFLIFLETKIRWLAGATFTLYLMHQPILIAMASIMPGERDSKAWAIAVVAASLLIVCLVAEVSERRKAFWRMCFDWMFRVTQQFHLPVTEERSITKRR